MEHYLCGTSVKKDYSTNCVVEDLSVIKEVSILHLNSFLM